MDVTNEPRKTRKAQRIARHEFYGKPRKSESRHGSPRREARAFAEQNPGRSFGQMTSLSQCEALGGHTRAKFGSFSAHPSRESHPAVWVPLQRCHSCALRAT